LKDVFSLPEKGGRRNILLAKVITLIGDNRKSPEIMLDLLSGIAKWTEANGSPVIAKKGSANYPTEVIGAWRRNVQDADGKKKQEMVKYYLDLAESVMKKHSEDIKDALLNPFKSSVSNYDAMDLYDENVMDRFKVKKVYFVDKYYSKRGMVDFPTDEEFEEFISDMSKKGIEVMRGTAKEIADMVNSSLGKDGATKYFEGSEYDLSYLLLPVGQTQQIGAEKQDKKSEDGVERYSNQFGSYRYVMKMGDEIVGAIQVMSRDKSKGVAANVFVKPEHRRKGIAKKLLVQAKKDFDEVEYNPDQSDDGKAWVSSVSEQEVLDNLSERIYNKILKGL